MHALSNTVPRLFGRASTPAPNAQTSQAAQTEPQAQTPRAKLVRRGTTGHNMAMPASPMSTAMTPVTSPGSPSSSAGRPGGPPFEQLHREGSLASASASAYEALLNGPDRSSLCGSIGSGQHHAQPHHRYYAVRSQRNMHRTWLAATDARRRPSWSGERPPPRKLVKDPNGSARPSASREILDEDELRHKAADGQDKGTSGSLGTLGTLGIRRKMARWRELRW